MTETGKRVAPAAGCPHADGNKKVKQADKGASDYRAGRHDGPLHCTWCVSCWRFDASWMP
jgi:hypothetical protein